MVKVTPCHFFEGESTDLLERRISQMLSNRHIIIGVAIVEHPLGDGRGSMFTVCENAYLLRPLDERFVKRLPGTARQRDDTHIVIGHHQPMSQHLQGVERGKDHHLRLRKR